MPSSDSEIENEPLLPNTEQDVEIKSVTPLESYWNRKTTLFCLIVFTLGLFFLVSAIVISYLLYFQHVLTLKILALNVWGMPARLGSQDKELRIKAIGDFIQQGDYDLYLLSELWMRPDHQTIQTLLPDGYFITTVEDLAISGCDGVVLPRDCSGLAIVSKFPFVEKEFIPYKERGDWKKLDGEFWAQKGAGRVRIEPYKNFIADIFVTHTCAVGTTYTNAYYRQKQIQQLAQNVMKSKADFIIVGGDFNTDPRDKETSYHTLQSILVNSIAEFFVKISEWLCPKRATYGNPQNAYSNMYEPVLYDYLWHKATGKNMIWTNYFHIPFLKTEKIVESKTNTSVSDISFSDHEAVTSNLLLWKHKL
eukprot:GFUD01009441.1.p1 GENE.GFUD01009441.1~~GFUD01009441.1.p1  ORF type:complete len:364 (+),score=71.49 GFUD01009441.1:178-1269(+)